MDSKNTVEVLIGGEKYTLCGYESEEYLQSVVTYLNSKIAAVEKSDVRMTSRNIKNLLVNLTIADDYLKLKEAHEELKKEKEDTDKLIFELKHELASIKTK